jgi:transglutaminase-like putative cysteine protease
MLRLTGVQAGAVRIEARAPAGTLLAWPNPPPLMGLEVTGIETRHVDVLGEAASDFGAQHAWVARVSGPSPSITLRYSEAVTFAPDWAWTPPDVALNRPSTELVALAREITSGLEGQTRVYAIMRHVSSVFHYGHGEGRFTDDALAVPALTCGLTRGSCVDIHTYAVAALHASGIDAAYCAGVFWRDGLTTFEDMHCWIIVGGDTPSVWDISHDLIASRDVAPNFDSVSGRRFPLALGRSVSYSWGGATWQFSHFAKPHVLTPDGGYAFPADTVFTVVSG